MACSGGVGLPDRQRQGTDAVQRLKHFGWGREGEGLSGEETAFIVARYRECFGVDGFEQKSPPPLSEIELPASRLTPPAALQAISSTDRYERAAHTFGKSFPDTVRGLAGDYSHAPDVVMLPRDEAEVAAILDWAAS